jgi:cell division protein FtsB
MPIGGIVMDRADILYADVVRLQKEVEELKAANRELFECVQELEEEIKLLKGGPADGGTF